MAAGAWHQEWAAALDDLEADVATVEAMLAEDHRVRDNPVVDPWTPPQGLGPLPLDLKPRAHSILERQTRAAQALALAIVATRKQATMAGRIEHGSNGAARPAFVDQAM